jgi:hypothetical protein
MRERVELANGTFMVHSAPGRGTTVVASLPMGAVPAAREFSGDGAPGPANDAAQNANGGRSPREPDPGSGGRSGAAGGDVVGNGEGGGLGEMLGLGGGLADGVGDGVGGGEGLGLGEGDGDGLGLGEGDGATDGVGGGGGVGAPSE